MNLSDLTTCGHGWAEERAKLALQLTAQRSSGAISSDECAELLEDLISTDRLQDEADNMQIKAALISAINIASKVL
jgi:hypothetical protein